MKKWLAVAAVLALLIVPQMVLGFDFGGDTYNDYTYNITNQGGEGGEAKAFASSKASSSLWATFGQQQQQQQGIFSSYNPEISQTVISPEPKTEIPYTVGELPRPANVNVYDNTTAIGLIKGVSAYDGKPVSAVLKVEKYGTFGGQINRWEVARAVLKASAKLTKANPDKTIYIRVTGRGVIKTLGLDAGSGGSANPTESIGAASTGNVGFVLNIADEFNVIEYLLCE